MDFPTETTRRLSDEELEGALAHINRKIQGLEEHARGRDDPAQWGEPRVGEAILQGLYRRRCRREEIKLELLHRGIAPNPPATAVATAVPAIADGRYKEDQTRPLVTAIDSSNLVLVQLLVGHGAQVHDNDIVLAIRMGNFDIAQALAAARGLSRLPEKLRGAVEAAETIRQLLKGYT